jgi:hypothetical protein
MVDQDAPKRVGANQSPICFRSKRAGMLAAPRRHAGCEKPKASRHAVAGLLAKTISVCPWRRSSRRPGETVTLLSLNVSPGHRAEPASPAESRLVGTLCWKVCSLSLKTPERMRASWAVLRGTPGVVPVTRACWGGVFAAQYRDRFGWPPGSLPKGPSHRPPLRAAPQSVRASGSGYGARPNTSSGCAPVPALLAHTLCCAVLTTETHQILCGKYPPGSTPRARHAPGFPTSQLEKMGAQKGDQPLRGEHDAGGFAAAWNRDDRHG